MATFKAVVLKTQKRIDGTYPVSIRLTHARKSCYINTGLYVGKSGITAKTFEIKDKFVIESTNRLIETFNKILLRMDIDSVMEMTCQDIKDVLQKHSRSLDFIEFARSWSQKTKGTSRKTAYISAINELTKVAGKSIDANRLSSAMLESVKIDMQSRGVNPNTQRNYFICIKTAYNEMKKLYNTELDTVIYRDPFLKFEMPKPVMAKKRLTSVDIIKDILCTSMNGTANIFIAMLAVSFLLCGTNIYDIVNMETEDTNGTRISYRRSKARNRYDGGRISYKVEPELRKVLNSYSHCKHLFGYIDRDGGRKAISAIQACIYWLRKKYGDDDLTTYSIRRAWANVAFEHCHATKDEIDMCLNHTGEFVDDLGYVNRVSGIIDKTNRKVIDYVLGK